MRSFISSSLIAASLLSSPVSSPVLAADLPDWSAIPETVAAGQWKLYSTKGVGFTPRNLSIDGRSFGSSLGMGWGGGLGVETPFWGLGLEAVYGSTSFGGGVNDALLEARPWPRYKGATEYTLGSVSQLVGYYIGMNVVLPSLVSVDVPMILGQMDLRPVIGVDKVWGKGLMAQEGMVPLMGKLYSTGIQRTIFKMDDVQFRLGARLSFTMNNFFWQPIRISLDGGIKSSHAQWKATDRYSHMPADLAVKTSGNWEKYFGVNLEFPIGETLPLQKGLVNLR